MSYRASMMVPAFLLASTFPVVYAAPHLEKIRNEKVVVLEETLAPGEAETNPVSMPSVVVYMAGNGAEIQKAHIRPQKTPVRDGGVLFQPANSGALRNTGTAPLHFVRIEYLTKGSFETWGATGLAPNYKVLFENAYGRVYDIKIRAGAREPQHTHHDRIVIALSGAKLEHLLPSGERQPSTLKTGEIVWRRGGTHVGHNMGTTNLWVIAVEPK